jgi:hypothetical protein
MVSRLWYLRVVVYRVYYLGARPDVQKDLRSRRDTHAETSLDFRSGHVTGGYGLGWYDQL